MGVFTFVCKQSGAEWSAKQLKGDLESSGDSTFDLQRNLVQVALSADSSGPVQSSFTYVTPSSAVFQVVVGGNVGGGSFVVSAASSGGGDAPPAEEKKEAPEEEEESDEEPIHGLFDDEEY